MLKRLSTIFVLMIAAASLFAGEPGQRTVFVRDGKVVLDEGGPVGKRAFIGVALVELTPDLREYFGAPKDAGVLVSSVSKDGPAAKAGVRVGDVITAANGTPVTSYWSLVSSIKDKHAGDAIRLDVIRAKASQTIVATAEEREGLGIRRAFDLGQLESLGKLESLGSLSMPEWKAKLITPENQELRIRIRDLENRLQELEKKLQQK